MPRLALVLAAALSAGCSAGRAEGAGASGSAPAARASPDPSAAASVAAPAAAPAPRADVPRGAVLEEVSGTVREVDRSGHRLAVDVGAERVTLSLDRNTMVYTPAGLGTVHDVAPGAQIRAGRNADFLAYWIQVRGPPSRAQPTSAPGQGTGPAGGAGAPPSESGGAPGAVPGGPGAGQGGAAPIGAPSAPGGAMPDARPEPG